MALMLPIEHAQSGFGLDRQDGDPCDRVIVVVQMGSHQGGVE